MKHSSFMQYPLVILLSFFFIAGVVSIPTFADDQKEEGFFYPDDLEIYPEGIEEAYEASTAFPVGFSNCSGAYISPDGYYLTAYHCVIAALGLTSQYTRELAPKAEVVVVPPEDVIGKRYQSFFGGFKATVVDVGEGSGQFDERLADTYEEGVLEEIQDVIGTDWAILKVDNIQDHACLVAADETPAEDDYTWTIGYPAPTKRNVGERTNNRTKLISFGKVSYTAEETGFYKTLSPTNRALALDFWAYLSDRGEYFFTDADSQGGNSGSPVINEFSELTGVLVQGLMPTQQIAKEKFHTYSSGVIDLQTIRETLGEDTFDEYFTCGL